MRPTIALLLMAATRHARRVRRRPNLLASADRDEVAQGVAMMADIAGSTCPDAGA
jgi:hypothetical protein